MIVIHYILFASSRQWSLLIFPLKRRISTKATLYIRRKPLCLCRIYPYRRLQTQRHARQRRKTEKRLNKDTHRKRLNLHRPVRREEIRRSICALGKSRINTFPITVCPPGGCREGRMRGKSRGCVRACIDLSYHPYTVRRGLWGNAHGHEVIMFDSYHLIGVEVGDPNPPAGLISYIGCA